MAKVVVLVAEKACSLLEMTSEMLRAKSSSEKLWDRLLMATTRDLEAESLVRGELVQELAVALVLEMAMELVQNLAAEWAQELVLVWVQELVVDWAKE